MSRKIFISMIVGLIVFTYNNESFSQNIGHPGRQFYLDHDYSAAISSCNDIEDFESILILALSHSELYAIHKQKSDRKISKRYLQDIDNRLEFSDASILMKYTNIPGKINANKIATKLFRSAMKNLVSPPQVMLAFTYLNPKVGSEVNETTLEAIKKYLKKGRSYVNKGGVIPLADRQVYEDQNLLTAIFYQLFNKNNDSLAKECFVLIEEPALNYLKIYKNAKVTDTLKILRKKINSRQKKMPYSKWYGVDVFVN